MEKGKGKTAYSHKIMFRLDCGKIMCLAKTTKEGDRPMKTWEIIQAEPFMQTKPFCLYAGEDQWEETARKKVSDEVEHLNIRSLSRKEQMRAYCRDSYPGGSGVGNMKYFYSVNNVKRMEWNRQWMHICAHLEGASEGYEQTVRSDEELIKFLDEAGSFFSLATEDGQRLCIEAGFIDSRSGSHIAFPVRALDRGRLKDLRLLHQKLDITSEDAHAALAKAYEAWDLSGQEIPEGGIVSAVYDSWNDFRNEWTQLGYSEDQIIDLLASNEFIPIGSGRIIRIAALA